MTMRELAKLANVSIATVSKAFCDAPDISRETREHIFQIAKQAGCFGKYYKGKYPKKTIAIICPELAGGFYTCFVEELQALISGAGCIPVVSTDAFGEQRQQELLEYYASYLRVDGIIVFSLSTSIKKGYETPIVALFSSTDNAVDSVNVDLRPAMIAAVETLIGLGHRDVAFLGETLTWSKEELFRQVAAQKGLFHPAVINSDRRFEEAGEEGITRLLATNSQVTAVICAYDNIAVGAIKQLKRCGQQVPRDMSVIGMDNISLTRYSEVTLTSVDTNPREVCMVAWDLLQKKMKNPYYRSRQNIVINASLIHRDSIGPMNKAKS